MQTRCSSRPAKLGSGTTILFLGSIYRIHLWFDWVPSKQNFGDPYSQLKTGKKEIAELDASIGAMRFTQAWPSFIRAGPTVWRQVFQSQHAPSTWFVTKQVDMLIELGIARPEEFVFSLSYTLSIKNSPFVTLTKIQANPRNSAHLVLPATNGAAHQFSRCECPWRTCSS